MIEENISLKKYNTLNIDVRARYFTEAFDKKQLIEILQDPGFKDLPKLFLGGGSNILLLNDFKGVVIRIGFKGINIIEENDDYAIVNAAAGEIWHHFVLYTISENLSGLENLSLIPGTVGAAPMQNIGAYGVEVKDTFQQLEALNLETLDIEVFDREKCAFGYRESFFKHEGKGRYVILNVSFKLSKTPLNHISYGAIQQTLLEMNVADPTIKNISDAVIRIRSSKLPDPREIPNAGSFFKNPVIPQFEFDRLKMKFDNIPGYQLPDDKVKVPAGWLIEKAGWKGRKLDRVGVHDKQALVLINHNNGTGNEIKDLASSIQNDVFTKFGIKIIPEVNYIN